MSEKKAISRESTRKIIQALIKRNRELEQRLDALIEHVNNLQDQQIAQYVLIQAEKEFLIEGRQPSLEKFNERCNSIYGRLKLDAQGGNEDAVSQAESEGRESSTENVVDEPSEVPAG